jgi:signal peptidase II
MDMQFSIHISCQDDTLAHMKKISSRLLGAWIGLFVGLLVLDQWTKIFMADWLALGQSVPVIDGFFNFTLVHNRGAAFGMGSTWSTPFFLTTSFLAMGVVIYLFSKLKPEEKLSRWAMVMILSGAVGNIIDRVRLGYVIDFLDVYVQNHHWPVFNVADSAITVGAILFALDSLIISARPAKPHASDAAEPHTKPLQ